MQHRGSNSRPNFRCAVCDAELGPKPWLGASPDLYTACGCYAQKEQAVRIPSSTEKVQAILDARQDVAEYLGSIDKLDVFASFTKDEICGLIRAAQDGVQKSLHRQLASAMSDEIPF